MLNNNNIENFHDLAITIAMQDRIINTQNKLISYHRAKNYSIVRRNIFLVKCNRALYILIAILLIYIALSVVVGVRL